MGPGEPTRPRSRRSLEAPAQKAPHASIFLFSYGYGHIFLSVFRYTPSSSKSMDMEEKAMEKASVGQRISVHGNRGTVRYVGQVHGAQGIWLGVEWDEPSRGKHSGEKDGRRYFDCSLVQITFSGNNSCLWQTTRFWIFHSAYCGNMLRTVISECTHFKIC